MLILIHFIVIADVVDDHNNLPDQDENVPESNESENDKSKYLFNKNHNASLYIRNQFKKNVRLQLVHENAKEKFSCTNRISPNNGWSVVKSTKPKRKKFQQKCSSVKILASAKTKIPIAQR